MSCIDPVFARSAGRACALGPLVGVAVLAAYFGTILFIAAGEQVLDTDCPITRGFGMRDVLTPESPPLVPPKPQPTSAPSPESNETDYNETQPEFEDQLPQYVYNETRLLKSKSSDNPKLGPEVVKRRCPGLKLAPPRRLLGVLALTSFMACAVAIAFMISGCWVERKRRHDPDPVGCTRVCTDVHTNHCANNALCFYAGHSAGRGGCDCCPDSRSSSSTSSDALAPVVACCLITFALFAVAIFYMALAWVVAHGTLAAGECAFWLAGGQGANARAVAIGEVTLPPQDARWPPHQVEMGAVSTYKNPV